MLKYEEGKVVPIDDCHLVKNPLNKLYTNDRNEGKKFFKEAITYAYFMYSKGGIYENLFPRERAKEISRVYFGDANYYEKFEYNKAFTDFKLYYESIQYDATARALLSTEKEIEELILHLKDVQYFIDGQIDVEVDIPLYKDSTEFVKKAIKTKVKISNYKEKKDSLIAIKEILGVRKMLKEEVKIRAAELKNEESRSLLDKNQM